MDSGDNNHNFIAVKDMYEQYTAYCSATRTTPIPNTTVFGKYVKEFFNNVKVVQRKWNKTAMSFYTGLKVIQTPTPSHPMTLYNIAGVLSDNYNFILADLNSKEEALKLIYIYKTLNNKIIELHWSKTCVRVTVASQVIDLLRLGFPTEIPFHIHTAHALGIFLTKMRMCSGREMGDKYSVLPGIVLEHIQGKQRLRSVRCELILQTTGTTRCCKTCQQVSNNAFQKKLKVRNFSILF